MKASTIGMLALSAAFAFVVYAAFSPAPGGASVPGPALSDALASGRPVLLQFTATWCGPCRRVKPDVQALAREVQGKAEVVAIDVDAHRAVAAKYKVSGIPCFVAVKDGREVARRTGAISKAEMKRMLGL